MTNARGSGLLPGPALENQGGVGAAKTERIRESVIHGGLARNVGNVVEITVRIRLFLIDRRRQGLIAQRKNTNAAFKAACAAEEMTGHGLGGADRQFLVDGAFTEKSLHC